MPFPTVSMRQRFCLVCCVVLWLPCMALAQVSPKRRAVALIQTRGTPLQAGVMKGGGQVALERAEGGDTPILTFTSPRGPVRLLIDTGAAASMVTLALVQRLGLSQRPLPPEDFSLLGGGIACESLKIGSTFIPTLNLQAAGEGPSLQIEGMEALVIPGAPLPPRVDGVLGAPTLRQLPLAVDPRAEIVAIGGSALRWRQTMTSQPRVVPLIWRQGLPLLPLRVRLQSGGTIQTLHGLADTGAEGVFLTPELAERLTPQQVSQPARLVGVCGEQAVRRQRLLGLGTNLERSPGEAVEAIILVNPVFARLKVEAIVGQGLLRSRRQLWRLDADPARLELW